MLYVDMDNSPEPAPSAPPKDAWTTRSQAYRTEQSPGRPMSRLRLLSSSLAQFAPQRDLALIAANVSHSSYTVLRERDPSALRLLPTRSSSVDSSNDESLAPVDAPAR